jgi:acyl-CoA synthetase (AMP-forming)/AMP-acid ligase II
MDEDGYLPHIVDRKKDLILTAGFSVYPREVEKSSIGTPGFWRRPSSACRTRCAGKKVTATVLKPGRRLPEIAPFAGQP